MTVFLYLKQRIDVVPLSMWTGETEREGIGHKGSHDLIATSGYFQAKPYWGDLLGIILEVGLIGPGKKACSLSHPCLTSLFP